MLKLLSIISDYNKRVKGLSDLLNRLSGRCVKMYYMSTQLGDWLLDELRKRDWSQNELARRSGLTSGTISNIVTGRMGGSKQTLKAIARALRVPTEIIFVEAGLLSRELIKDRETELLFLFRRLPDHEQERLLKTLHITLSMLEQGPLSPVDRDFD